MAYADDLVHLTVDHIAQIARARHAKRANRQDTFIDIGHHLAMAESELRLELFLEPDAAGDRSFDEDTDEAFTARPRDEAMRFGAGDVELFCDLALGATAGEVKPSGTRRERCLLVDR